MLRSLLICTVILTSATAAGAQDPAGPPVSDALTPTSAALTLNLLGLQYNTLPWFSAHGAGMGDDAPAYRRRSGYIHPLRSPGGVVLTGLEDPGHPHQLGLFHAWTKTRWRGGDYDFWNLKQPVEEEMIRHQAFDSLIDGPQAYGFTARRVWTVQPAGAPAPTPVLNELLIVRGRQAPEGNLIDYRVEQRIVGDAPLELPQHTYGGALAWRLPPEWPVDTLLLVASNGAVGAAADNTRARWVLASGQAPGQPRAGLLLMSHPDNFRHPEPLRVLYEPGGQGGYVHFTPVRLGDWRLDAGQTYTFRYRLCAFDDALSTPTAERLWTEYVQPPGQ